MVFSSNYRQEGRSWEWSRFVKLQQYHCYTHRNNALIFYRQKTLCYKLINYVFELVHYTKHFSHFSWTESLPVRPLSCYKIVVIQHFLTVVEFLVLKIRMLYVERDIRLIYRHKLVFPTTVISVRCFPNLKILHLKFWNFQILSFNLHCTRW